MCQSAKFPTVYDYAIYGVEKKQVWLKEVTKNISQRENSITITSASCGSAIDRRR